MSGVVGDSPKTSVQENDRYMEVIESNRRQRSPEEARGR